MTYRQRRRLGLIKPRPRHPRELREAIVRRYLTAGTQPGWRGKPQRAVKQRELAREYGMNASTVSRWVTEALGS